VSSEPQLQMRVSRRPLAGGAGAEQFLAPLLGELARSAWGVASIGWAFSPGKKPGIVTLQRPLTPPSRLRRATSPGSGGFGAAASDACESPPPCGWGLIALRPP